MHKHMGEQLPDAKTVVARIMQGQQVCSYCCDIGIYQKAACKKQHIDNNQLLYNIR
jgi:cell fate (sporulation/competence/biofilm development) regulator YmcA (YheA/YmcA/DUF963 family)